FWIRSSPPGIRTSTATTGTGPRAHGRRKLPPSITALTRGPVSIHHPPHQWRMHAGSSHHSRTGHLQTPDSWQDQTKSRTASLTLNTSTQSHERPDSPRGYFTATATKSSLLHRLQNQFFGEHLRRSEGIVLKMFRAKRDIEKQILQSDAQKLADTAATNPRTIGERCFGNVSSASETLRKQRSQSGRAGAPAGTTPAERHTKTTPSRKPRQNKIQRRRLLLRSIQNLSP